MGIVINEIKDKYTILLHKTNETIIGELPFDTLISLSNSLNEIGTINLKVNKYYKNPLTKSKERYIYYDEIKNERMISLDGYFYVIKEITEDNINQTKNITAYSKEKKLEKIVISVEDLGFYLQDEDDSIGVFSLDNYMYEETGWKFGYIDHNVRYNEDYSPKMRWQESIDTSWLDFLKNNIANGFNCYVHFDTKKQLVNLYEMSSYGENLQICLSYDNYIKSLEKESSTSDIVTKMKLIGNENECVISDFTVTGTDYIENYSYFMENREMSDELINALNLYYEMTAERTTTWKQLREELLNYEEQLRLKKNEELIALSNITTLNTSYKYYISKVGTDADPLGNYAELATETAAEIEEWDNKHKTLYKEIQTLENNISTTSEAIRNINILCQKKTATDHNGNLIFDKEGKLLDELKKFIYYETFSDDSYYDAEEMIADGTKKLEILSKPTKTWNIDVDDFTKRIVGNKFRQQWKGVLSLGDIIILYDINEDTEQFVYLVGYEKNYENGSLSLTLSNKKESGELTRYINDWLKVVKSNNKLITKSKRLLNAQKYNRINIYRSEVK